MTNILWFYLSLGRIKFLLCLHAFATITLANFPPAGPTCERNALRRDLNLRSVEWQLGCALLRYLIRYSFWCWANARGGSGGRLIFEPVCVVVCVTVYLYVTHTISNRFVPLLVIILTLLRRVGIVSDRTTTSLATCERISFSFAQTFSNRLEDTFSLLGWEQLQSVACSLLIWTSPSCPLILNKTPHRCWGFVADNTFEIRKYFFKMSVRIASVLLSTLKVTC